MKSERSGEGGGEKRPAQPALFLRHFAICFTHSLFSLRGLGATLLISLALVTASRRVFAHPLDEYVQATYITIGTDSIRLDLALNPGVHIAERVFALVDVDGNGEATATEVRTYAERVLREITLSLDGDVLIPTLSSVEFPSVEELREGNGMIRLGMSAPAEGRSGDHVLNYYNSHEPLQSAYLATTYLPQDPIVITQQTRDWNQHGIVVRYTIARGSLLPIWIALVAAIAGAFFVLRWRIRRHPSGSVPIAA